MKMRRIFVFGLFAALGMSVLFGCGGSSAGIGGNPLATANFLASIIRSSVGTTTVFSRMSGEDFSVGSTVLAGPQLRAAAWTPSGGVDLIARPAGMLQSTANDVNASRVVVGKCIDAGLLSYPMKVDGATATALNWTSIGPTGEAQVINAAGVIGGIVYGTPNNKMVRQNTDNTLTNIGGLRSGVFTGINALGTMIGNYVLNDSGDVSGFIASGASITPFGVSGASHTYPKDINGSGVIVGREGLDSQVGRPFIRSAGGTITYLPLPTGYSNGWAICINDSGTIGGYVAQSDGSSPRAVIWVDGEPILLNSRVTLASGSVLTFVQDITPQNKVLATVQEGANALPCLLTPDI